MNKLLDSLHEKILKSKFSEEVTEALNKADKGLYYVKKTTKSSYVVWDEIKNVKGKRI